MKADKNKLPLEDSRHNQIVAKEGENKDIILVLFTRYWGEVDFILPVLFKLKEKKPDWRIIACFSIYWGKHESEVNNRTLDFELKDIVDDIVYFDPEIMSFPFIRYRSNVRLVLKEIYAGEINERLNGIHEIFPSAKIVAFPHALFYGVQQQFNRLRSFNLWQQFRSDHDLLLINHDLAAPQWFDKFFDTQLCVVGFPRLDPWWLERLRTLHKFIDSEEAQRAKAAQRTFLLIIKAAGDIDFPAEIFNYVVQSAFHVTLNSPSDLLLIKPHPRQNQSQLTDEFKIFAKSDNWMISSLHVMQLADLSDVVISVTSSTILDALAAGKPVIEFQPQVYPAYSGCIGPGGRLTSLYALHGLSLPAQSEDELAKAIHDITESSNGKSILQNQQKMFCERIPRDNSASDRAANVILNLVEPDTIDKTGLPPVHRSYTPITGERNIFLRDDGSKNSPVLNLELKRLKTFSMPVSSQFLRELAVIFNTDTAILTGTFNQHMVREADDLFRQVHAIESCSDLYQAQNFRLLSHCENLRIYHSSNILQTILPNVREKILFFLSAHEGASITFGSKTNTPVIEELRVIKEAGIKDAVILINNMRYFQPVKINIHGNEAKGRTYPTVLELVDAILDIDKSYLFYILGDISIACPPEYPVTASTSVKACTSSRLFDRSNLELDAVLDAEQTIAFSLPKQEKKAFQALHEDYASIEEPGVGAHYRLWNGLTLLGDKRYQEAKEEFSKAIALGCDQWRVHWLSAHAAQQAGDAATAKESLSYVAKNYAQRLFHTPKEIDDLCYKQHGMTRAEMNLEFIGEMDRSMRVLELGTNISSQLRLLNKMGFKDLSGMLLFGFSKGIGSKKSSGMELKRLPIELEQNQVMEISLSMGSIFNVPYSDNSLDLIFTSLVLTRTAPHDLEYVMKEIYRCSKRYIWGFEYYNDTPIEVSNRKNDQKMWKCDYVDEYLKRFPGLKVVKHINYTYTQNNSQNCMFLLEKK